MSRILFALGTILLLSLSGCIKDDLVDDGIAPRLVFLNKLDQLATGDSFQYDVRFLNEVGMEEERELIWTSSNPDLASIDENGLVSALLEGEVAISASLADGTVMASDDFAVGNATVEEVTQRTGSLETTSSYSLEGDFTLEEDENGDLILSFADNYFSSDNLPGLYVYLTNNPSTTNGAFEIGEVTVFSGSHSYILPSSVGLNTYSHVLYFCAPFNAKVGDGALNP